MIKRKHERSFERWLCEQQGVLPNTAVRYVLEALIPFTDANAKLVFRPNAFFNELERLDSNHYKKESLRRAYYEAKRRGYIVSGESGTPMLSEKAAQSLLPYRPKVLKSAEVMVIFDIPEKERAKRRWFRLLLRELKFQPIQQSVWMSKYDCFEVLSAGIVEQRLEEYVRVFEARAVENF